MPAGHRRHIRNYLLDRQLQLRYTLIIVLISSMLTAGLGYIWYQQMRVTSRTIEVKALASLTESDVQQIKDEMASQDNLRLLALIGFGILFAIVIAGYGIILTHKVAGPIYKISRHMMEVKDGNLGPIYDLRKGDQLHDFFNVFKLMHTSLRQQAEIDVKLLNESIVALEKHLGQAGGATYRQDDIEELVRYLDEMRQLCDQKKQSLLGRV